MKVTVSQIIEATAMLILVYLIASNARGVSLVVSSIGKIYTESIRSLQGR